MRAGRWMVAATLRGAQLDADAVRRLRGPRLSPTCVAFAPDGKLFMSMGGAFGVERPDGTSSFQGLALLAQDPSSYAGKLLRLNDDGTVPFDNPFVDREGYRPEIYALGIRNAIGMAFNPQLGHLWETENGPQGGDEINIIQPGVCMPVMEAMALGYPIVINEPRWGGEPEVCGPCADVVPGTAHGFTEALKRFIDNPHRVSEIGARSRATIPSFSGEKMEAQEKDLIMDLLAVRSG